MAKQSLETKMDVLLANFENFTKDFNEFKSDSRNFVVKSEAKNEKIEDKIDAVIVKNAELKIRTDNLTIFQSIFSVVVGAVATYLGATTKMSR